MAAFPEAPALEAEFKDFNDLAQATSGWNLVYTQAAGGAFSGSIRMAATPALQIVVQNWSAPLMVEGEQPRNMASIAMTMSASGGARWKGLDLDPHASVFGGSQGHEVDFRSLGEMEIMAVSMSHTLLDRHLGALFGIDGMTLGSELLWRIPHGTAGVPERGRALDLLRAVLANGAASSEAARHHLEEAVMQILLGGLQIEPRQGLVSNRQRSRIVRLAEEVLRARLNDPPSLSELCGLTAVSERVLQLAFQHVHGVSPKRYLRILRLNAARRKLRRCEGTVTEIAADLGFFHFARFAMEYRELFHQLPSETLRQARLEHGMTPRPSDGRCDPPAPRTASAGLPA